MTSKNLLTLTSFLATLTWFVALALAVFVAIFYFLDTNLLVVLEVGHNTEKESTIDVIPPTQAQLIPTPPTLPEVIGTLAPGLPDVTQALRLPDLISTAIAPFIDLVP